MNSAVLLQLIRTFTTDFADFSGFSDCPGSAQFATLRKVVCHALFKEAAHRGGSYQLEEQRSLGRLCVRARQSGLDNEVEQFERLLNGHDWVSASSICNSPDQCGGQDQARRRGSKGLSLSLENALNLDQDTAAIPNTPEQSPMHAKRTSVALKSVTPTPKTPEQSPMHAKRLSLASTASREVFSETQPSCSESPERKSSSARMSESDGGAVEDSLETKDADNYVVTIKNTFIDGIDIGSIEAQLPECLPRQPFDFLPEEYIPSDIEYEAIQAARLNYQVRL